MTTTDERSPASGACILTGPTASGKSAAGLILAERLDAEIICMDSMTLYRGMDIGTAKPSSADRLRISHHLLDSLDPWEGATVAWWLAAAADAAKQIRQRGKQVLFLGGTPLYLKALLCGLFNAPPVDPGLRCELESQSADELHRRLQTADPTAARRIHPHDHKRLVRALEVYRQTRQPITALQKQFANVAAIAPAPLWLDLPRGLLYARIEARVDAMMTAGWLDEVRSLQSLPRPLSRQAAQAAGYRELADHLAGRHSLEQAVALTKTRIRQLAKRQLTWLRNFPGLLRVPLTGNENAGQVARLCQEAWNAGSPL
jgi:tRNA dimethylallyltransferase